MQKYCSELTERLLKSLDKEYNVIDMGVVVDIISVLEKTTITKEVLEITRLGKHINELRRKTDNDALARRAKDLVRRWRDMVLPSAHSTPQPTPADTAPPALNGAKPHSPALRSLKPHSPALRGLKPQSPLLKDATSLRVLSPALSLHSDHSRSPNAPLNKQSIILTSNHRISSTNVSPVFGSSSQNHTTEAVPRTHSSNKRLRKEDGNKEQRHYYQTLPEFTQSMFGVEEPTVKRQRHNGENISGNLNLQVPSPTLKERISSDRFAETSLEVTDESGPKKRGRKKGSKSAKRQTLLDDRVKEKIASISRNPKLKTTQELLADLQARGANCSSSAVGAVLPSQSGVAEPPSMEDILRGNSSESKYLRCSQKNSSHHKGGLASETSSDSRTQVSRSRKSAENCRERSPDSCQERSRDDRTDVAAGSSTCRSSPRRDLTVEEILAKLPPLDLKSIDWSDCEPVESTEERNGVECSPRPEPTVEDLERLQMQCVEGLNGNYQARLPSAACTDDGGEQRLATNQGNGVSVGLSNTGGVKSVYNNNNQTDGAEFREWHQMLARPSYQGETLHILPYVIID
ncbi:mediator of RNA polymerase II transcription subunit 26 isoform X2 [Odontomachus brunneus]|uniref:mediator of RNA polymerase II transcription subunit 26 isoform X2 n=1 Tax=Odontomachus brunneus TaxID=486640 RepID=UPI0013F22BF2|nr:mediator of RNA polymerase II transcription subunit 26 isoform X2 [Odontomachus brunneus]